MARPSPPPPQSRLSFFPSELGGRELPTSEVPFSPLLDVRVGGVAFFSLPTPPSPNPSFFCLSTIPKEGKVLYTAE